MWYIHVYPSIYIYVYVCPCSKVQWWLSRGWNGLPVFRQAYEILYWWLLCLNTTMLRYKVSLSNWVRHHLPGCDIPLNHAACIMCIRCIVCIKCITGIPCIHAFMHACIHAWIDRNNPEMVHGICILIVRRSYLVPHGFVWNPNHVVGDVSLSWLSFLFCPKEILLMIQ